jgi:hypothetical protein
MIVEPWNSGLAIMVIDVSVIGKHGASMVATRMRGCSLRQQDRFRRKSLIEQALRNDSVKVRFLNATATDR